MLAPNVPESAIPESAQTWELPQTWEFPEFTEFQESAQTWEFPEMPTFQELAKNGKNAKSAEIGKSTNSWKTGNSWETRNSRAIPEFAPGGGNSSPGKGEIAPGRGIPLFLGGIGGYPPRIAVCKGKYAVFCCFFTKSADFPKYCIRGARNLDFRPCFCKGKFDPPGDQEFPRFGGTPEYPPNRPKPPILGSRPGGQGNG
jgi:hypothetical protein